MAALEEGRQYGLSSSASLLDQRSVVQVKLTDSALRSIDEFLRHKVWVRFVLYLLRYLP